MRVFVGDNDHELPEGCTGSVCIVSDALLSEQFLELSVSAADMLTVLNGTLEGELKELRDQLRTDPNLGTLLDALVAQHGGVGATHITLINRCHLQLSFGPLSVPDMVLACTRAVVERLSAGYLSPTDVSV